MKNFAQFSKILLFSFVLSALFLYPHSASAFFDVIPSMADMQLGALDVVDQVMAWIFNILLLALAGAFFIIFSAGFLDWAANLSVNLTNNPLVNAGWGFTSGLVNIIFILILIAIAFSYILKLENAGNWASKKSLRNLIIIAFLNNFSLLFVKMFADIGWIVQHSLKISLFGTGNMAGPIASQVGGNALDAVAQYTGTFFLPYFVTAMIPFANVARAVWLATAILGEGLFGTFSETFLLAMFGIVGGTIFFVYAILFLMRIVIIWLLAIAAPLALAAYILPQTQKYFSQWLKTLFQWTFLGVIMFFLMGLGLKLYTAMAPPFDPFNVGGFAEIKEQYAQMIFLLIYLSVSLIAAKKFTPTGGNAVWKLTESLTKGGKAAVGTFGGLSWRDIKQFRDASIESKKREEQDWATHYYPGLSLKEARQQYKAQTSVWQRLKTAPGRERRAFAGGWAAVVAGRKAAKRGGWSAITDSAKAGWDAARKKGKKKKPKKTKLCTNCGKWTDADDTFCKDCGNIFP